MRQQISRIAILAVLLVTMGWSAAQAAVVVYHRYDFETATNYVTEPNWTHWDTSAGMYTSAGLPGWMASSAFSWSIDRGSSTQVPLDVTRDLVGGGYGTNPDYNVGFRDIIPVGATSVTYTIYRSDPPDSYVPNYKTYESVNGAARVEVNGGGGSWGGIQPPIVVTRSLTPSMTTGTLDLTFLYYSGHPSTIRLNGIEFAYTIPEPASLGLLALGGLLMFRRR